MINSGFRKTPDHRPVVLQSGNSLKLSPFHQAGISHRKIFKEDIDEAGNNAACGKPFAQNLSEASEGDNRLPDKGTNDFTDLPLFAHRI